MSWTQLWKLQDGEDIPCWWLKEVIADFAEFGYAIAFVPEKLISSV